METYRLTGSASADTDRALANELGLDANEMASAGGREVLAGNTVPAHAMPLAQVYAGHQFGSFSPQRGDGLSALGPVLREYLMGEAMHALGIPTTRALAAVATGGLVQREQTQPGGILVRVAASHLRVGTFEFFAARNDQGRLRRLADYAIARHDLVLTGTPDRYLAFLQAVAERHAQLVARWMGVGFIHGVMNTDNMAISGETLDYGPCAFMEHFDPGAVFSSIDTSGRYAYGRQPVMAQWNLARLAEALLPLIDTDTASAARRAEEVVQAFAERFNVHWTAVLQAKLGLNGTGANDRALADDYLTLLREHHIDFTLAFARLTDAASGDDMPLRTLFGSANSVLAPWLERWRARVEAVVSNPVRRLMAMRRANPIYIARNHQVEAALAAAVERDDLAPFERLLQVLERPFDEHAVNCAFAEPAPPEQTACYRTFCGT